MEEKISFQDLINAQKTQADLADRLKDFLVLEQQLKDPKLSKLKRSLLQKKRDKKFKKLRGER